MNIKKRVFKIKRVVQEILLLRKNYYNWDGILKRSLSGKSSIVLNHRSGINFYNSDNNTLSIVKEIFINEVYTSNHMQINEGDVVFDVGANVGIFSLYASLVKGTKIYSFEPHPDNYKKLEYNVRMNNIDSISCFNYGLAMKKENRIMIEANIPGGHKISNNLGADSKNSEGVIVKTTTLDLIMKELKIEKIDFLKLDCEGAEGEIISSLGINGLKKIEKIAIEFHDNHSILNHEQIVERLEDAGFSTILKWDGKSYFGYVYGTR